MYQVVEFEETNDVAIISKKWLTNDQKCAFWPPYKSSNKMHSALDKHQTPTDNWSSYGIKRVMYKTDNYNKALEKLKHAEDESDLQTDVEQTPKQVKRNKRPNPKYISDSEESDRSGRVTSDEEYPLPPPKVTLPSKSSLSTSTPKPSKPTEPSTSRPSTPSTSTYRPSTSSTSTSRQSASTPSISTSTPSTATPRPSTSATNTAQPQLSLFSQTQRTPRPQTPPQISETTLPPSPEYTLPRPSESRQGLPSPRPSPRRRGSTLLSERDIRIFRILEEMKTEQQEQRAMLSYIIQKLDGGVREADAPEGVNLPVNSVEEMGSVELALSDSSVKKIMVNYLASIGGSSVKTMTKRLMKTILTNQIAVNYNWTGAKNKNPFGTLKICSSVQKAVRKNFSSANASEVELQIKDWLRNAKDRDGGRKKRMRVVEEESD